MASSARVNIWRYIGIGFLVLVWLGCIGIGMVLYERTLVSWWLPLGLSGVLAAVSGIVCERFWRGVTTSRSPILNFICNQVFAMAVFSALILGVNYWLASASSAHSERVTIERKYTEKRYHSQRVGKHSYRRGAPYYVYYAEVALSDGRKKELSLPKSQYNRLRTGSGYDIQMKKGAFGLPVFSDLEFHPVAVK
jgi:hypothetical protein